MLRYQVKGKVHQFSRQRTIALKSALELNLASLHLERNRWSLSTLGIRLERPLQAKCWVTQLSWWSLSVSSPGQITHQRTGLSFSRANPRDHIPVIWPERSHSTKGSETVSNLPNPIWKSTPHWRQPLLPRILGEDPNRNTLCGAKEASLQHPVSSPGKQTFFFLSVTETRTGSCAWDT